MTASPFDQLVLLDVQGLDTRLAQLAHRRQGLPEHARLGQLRSRLADLEGEIVTARTQASDIEREVAKAEADVDLVRQRAARDRSRLDAGQGSAKDLSALQHELTSLARRQAELEDGQLEVMERLETVQQRLGELLTEQASVGAEAAQVEGSLDEQVGALDAEADQVRAEREGRVAGLAPELVALYEKIRDSSAGIGAAALRLRRCEGCRLELNPTDLARILTAPPDAVIRCEECRRILVRTPDSGL